MTNFDKLLESRRRHPSGQFGTSDDECTDNGALGCTHTIWRIIAWAYLGKSLTHEKLVAALRLPFVYKGNLSSSNLLRASRVGPCLFAMRYGDWPNWAHYGGVTRPRPWARPTDAAGRNQFTGFTGSHAGLLLGYKGVTLANGTFVRNDCYVVEPNHDSPARPQNVAYDIVTQTQLNAAYQAVRTKLGWAATMAFVPSKGPTFPGGL
jgi:hypothetical protein